MSLPKKTPEGHLPFGLYQLRCGALVHVDLFAPGRDECYQLGGRIYNSSTRMCWHPGGQYNGFSETQSNNDIVRLIK